MEEILLGFQEGKISKQKQKIVNTIQASFHVSTNYCRQSALMVDLRTAPPLLLRNYMYVVPIDLGMFQESWVSS